MSHFFLLNMLGVCKSPLLQDLKNRVNRVNTVYFGRGKAVFSAGEDNLGLQLLILLASDLWPVPLRYACRFQRWLVISFPLWKRSLESALH
jgi:hypothetical protein